MKKKLYIKQSRLALPFGNQTENRLIRTIHKPDQFSDHSTYKMVDHLTLRHFDHSGTEQVRFLDGHCMYSGDLNTVNIRNPVESGF
jgi:hypothetical protein